MTNTATNKDAKKGLESRISGQEVQQLNVRVAKGLLKGLKMMAFQEGLESEDESLKFRAFFESLLISHPVIKGAYNKNPDWFKIDK